MSNEPSQQSATASPVTIRASSSLPDATLRTVQARAVQPKLPARLGSGELSQAMKNLTSSDQRLSRLRLRPGPEFRVEEDKPRSMTGPDGVAKAVRQTMVDVAQMTKPWPLYFFGPPGRGKTMAALSLLDFCWLPYLYYTCKSLRDLLIVAQQGHCPIEWPYGIKEYEVWRHISRANIVVLDELAVSTKVTDHHYEAVVKVLDAREFKPLIVISNVTPDQLKTIYDDRIFSRACCGTLVDFSGYRDRRFPQLAGEQT